MLDRILFNGLLYEEKGAGISHYTHCLIDEFIAGGKPVDILLRKEFKQKYPYENIIFSPFDIASSTKRILAEQWQMRKCYRDYDVIHFPDYATPVLTNKKTIATIHDLAMYTMSDKYTIAQNVTKRTLLRNSIMRAARLICVSEFAKNELLNYFPQVEKKTVVIYEGLHIPKEKIPFDKTREWLARFGISPKNFILYVGTIAPHKNIETLLKGFAKLKQLGYQGKLVIAGGKGWLYDSVFSVADELALYGEIVFTDYVSRDELEILYQSAQVFVSMSLYEGFGFTPLEAMLREIPVVVSDIAVFHEMIQEAGIFCKGNDADELAYKLWSLLQNPAQCAAYGLKGKQRAQQFSWENTAALTYQVYLDVLNEVKR